MNRVGGLYAELSLRTGPWAKGFRKATQQAQAAGREIEQALGTGPQKSQTAVKQLAQYIKRLAATAKQQGPIIRKALQENMVAGLATAAKAVARLGTYFKRLAQLSRQVGLFAGHKLRDNIVGGLATAAKAVARLGAYFKRLAQLSRQVALAGGSALKQGITQGAQAAAMAIKRLGTYLYRLRDLATLVGNEIAAALTGGISRGQQQASGHIYHFIRIFDEIREKVRNRMAQIGTHIHMEIERGVTLAWKQMTRFRKEFEYVPSYVKILMTRVSQKMHLGMALGVGRASKALRTLRYRFEALVGVTQIIFAMIANTMVMNIRRGVNESSRAVRRLRDYFTTLPGTVTTAMSQVSDTVMTQTRRGINEASRSVRRLRDYFTQLPASLIQLRTQLYTLGPAFARTFGHAGAQIARIAAQARTLGPALRTGIAGGAEAVSRFIQHVHAAEAALRRALGSAPPVQALLNAIEQVNTALQRLSATAGAASSHMQRMFTSAKEGAQPAASAVRRSQREIKTNTRETGKKMQKSLGEKPQKALQETERKAARVTWAIRGYIKDTARVITGILIARTFYMLLKRIEQTISAAYELKQVFEEAALSFRYLMNATDRQAQAYAHSMRYWALDTQYSIREMTDAFRDLYFTGVMSIEQTESAIQILAGTATAAGRPLNELVSTMRRIATATHLSTSELRALTRAGIDVGPMLQEHLGLTTEELREINKLAIPGRVAFAAIMKGLSKYADAAVEGAKTVRAMWSDFMEVVVDLIGLITDDLWEGWRETLRRMLDWVAALREGILRLGPIGLFYLFPPELRKDMKAVVASLAAIWDGIRRVARLITHVFGRSLLFLIRVLANILPAIATFVQWIGSMADRARQASPVIDVLVSSVGALLVAYTAAAAVRTLLAWIIKLRIVKTIGSAFIWLGLTIKFVIKNIFILAAIIALLIGNLTAVRGVIEGLTGSVTDIFFPFEYLEEVDSDPLEGIAADITDIGDAAEDTAEKFKPFLAAFDEVYQIPEQTGAADGMREFPMPELPDVDIPTIRDLAWPDLVRSIGDDFATGFGNIMDILEEFEDFFSGWKGWLIAALLLFGNFIWRKIILPILMLLGAKLVQFFWTYLVPGIKTFLKNLPVMIGTFLKKLPGKILTFLKGIPAKLAKFFGGLKIVKWIKGAFNIAAIGAFLKKLPGKILTFIKGLPGKLIKFFGGLKIVKWITGAFNFVAIGKAIKTFFTITIPLLIKGAWPAIAAALGSIPVVGWVLLALAGIAAVIFVWGEDIIKWLRKEWWPLLRRAWEWIGERWERLVEIVCENVIDPLKNAWRRVSDWFNDNVIEPLKEAWAGFSRWWERTSESFIEWWEDLPGNIQRAVTETTETIRQWAWETYNRIREWVLNTAETIEQWVRSIPGRIREWAVNTARTIRRWAVETAGNIRRWVTDTIAGFRQWVTEAGETIGRWFRELPGRIRDWLLEALDTILGLIPTATETAGELGRAIVDGILGSLGGLGEGIARTISTVISGASDLISGIGSDIERSVESSVRHATAGMSGIGDSINRELLEVTKAVDNTVKEVERKSTTSKSAGEEVGEAMGSGTTAAFMESMGIRSPSLIERIMEQIVQSSLESVQSMRAIFTEIRGPIRDAWKGIADSILSVWTNMINELLKKTEDMLRKLSAMGMSGGSLKVSTSSGGSITALARGGVTRRDMLARIGEGNKPEAVIPLSEEALRPFADAIADKLGSLTSGDDRRPLYVGTLIADQRGLRELERQMRIIRIDEGERIGSGE